MRRGPTAAAVLGTLALVFPASASADLAHKQITVDERNRIVTVGGFRPTLGANRDPSVGAALERFGESSRIRPWRTNQSCEIGWSQHGLTIYFSNFAGRDPCIDGRAQEIVLRGEAARGWHTNRELYIRGRSSVMRERYRAVSRGRGAFSLQRTRKFIGFEDFRDVLTAQITEGRVSSLRLFPLAAGD